MSDRRPPADCSICGDDVIWRDGKWTHVTTYGDSMHAPQVATDGVRDGYYERLEPLIREALNDIAGGMALEGRLRELARDAYDQAVDDCPGRWDKRL